MAFIPVPNTAMAELRMDWDGQRVENTLYFEFTAPPASADLEALGNGLMDWWAADYAAASNNAVTLREVFLTSLDAVDAPVFTVTPALPIVGLRTGESLPNNCTIAISFRTALRGRSFRGRNFFVGLSVDGTSDSRVDPALLDLIRTAYLNIPDAVSDASAIWVVVSRFNDNAPRVTGLATPVQVPVIVDNVIDSQRRRLPGRGT